MDRLPARRSRPIVCRGAADRCGRVQGGDDRGRLRPTAATARGEALGLSEDELAFYDALGVNDSAVRVLSDETLRGIARELVETVRNNVTIDWTLRENVLRRDYTRPALDKQRLGQLIDLVSNIRVGDEDASGARAVGVAVAVAAGMAVAAASGSGTGAARPCSSTPASWAGWWTAPIAS